MSKLKVLVGKRLRQMRKERGLTQAALAERADMIDTYLAGVERGERNIALETLEKIMTALNAEPIDAFRFGELEAGKGLEGKRDVIRLLGAFLEERSMEEIELVRKMAKDIMATIDAEKRKMK
ncbi:helix-turn-helix domain-containing protein [Paenibacillus sp. GYB004]|uniref:helix-turn-helix domain-containing protein n=1 Tax=Paenibacillus sp. GYB004 TaxID=2994393 RepID=UPI002F96916A